MVRLEGLPEARSIASRNLCEASRNDTEAREKLAGQEELGIPPSLVLPPLSTGHNVRPKKLGVSTRLLWDDRQESNDRSALAYFKAFFIQGRYLEKLVACTSTNLNRVGEEPFRGEAEFFQYCGLLLNMTLYNGVEPADCWSGSSLGFIANSLQQIMDGFNSARQSGDFATLISQLRGDTTLRLAEEDQGTSIRRDSSGAGAELNPSLPNTAPSDLRATAIVAKIWKPKMILEQLSLLNKEHHLWRDPYPNPRCKDCMQFNKSPVRRGSKHCILCSNQAKVNAGASTLIGRYVHAICKECEQDHVAMHRQLREV
ncbi:Hypothetical Protein FCC1311_085332 [Hondaea fermentalgiana]|uniref:Uncharacterized protein n=1 Tax=Hondaea fermentalgiana TaxID=2315210 RepID=A0A2R5GRC0_9STRA|nr:Hypothetical Protein FCC1311_085332 [Hondaea fermentalgiana]|eukprot:GBG32308.1 Hypothetical Protein FCC1311_085332 [Hondaea fermentalgiana]